MTESKLFLKENPTIADFQQYVKEMKAERGFRVEPIYECCLLAEEVGELISEEKKNTKGGSIGSGSVAGNVKLELADVLIYLCSIANIHGINLEEAFREKEEINKQRTWKRL